MSSNETPKPYSKEEYAQTTEDAESFKKQIAEAATSGKSAEEIIDLATKMKAAEGSKQELFGNAQEEAGLEDAERTKQKEEAATAVKQLEEARQKDEIESVAKAAEILAKLKNGDSTSSSEKGINTEEKLTETNPENTEKKIDVETATRELKQKFNEFVTSIAKKNGLTSENEGWVKHLFDKAGNEMFLAGESAEKGEIYGKGAFDEMRENRKKILNYIEKLSDIKENYTEATNKLFDNDSELMLGVKQFNEKLKEINQSAKNQGQEATISFFSIEADNNSLRNRVFNTRDLAAHAIDSLKNTLKKIESIKGVID